MLNDEKDRSASALLLSFSSLIIFFMFTCAQIISTGGLYGAERVVLELSQFLRDNGHAPHVLILDSPGATQLHVAAQKLDLQAVIVPCRGAFDAASVRWVQAYVTAKGVQLAHSHGYKSDFWLGWRGWPRTVRRVATCHSWFSTTPKLKLFEWLDKRGLRRFDYVVGVAPQILAKLHAARVPESRTALITNGLSAPQTAPQELRCRVRQEFGLAPEQKLAVRVGRLDYIKGNHLLLDAWAGVRETVNARLLLVGDGPELAGLQAQAAQLGLTPDAVTFAGYRADAPEIIAAADVMVSPSLQEGLPMVLLEAMAARVPVITTNVGAISLVITDQQTGWLIPPDDAQALHHALQTALSDAATAQSYADAAFTAYTAQYSQTAMGRQYLALYERLLPTKTTTTTDYTDCPDFLAANL